MSSTWPTLSAAALSSKRADDYADARTVLTRMSSTWPTLLAAALSSKRADDYADARTISTHCMSTNYRLFALLDTVLHLSTEMPDQALNWPRSSIAQCTDCMAFNLLRNFPQHVNFLKVGIALLHARHDVIEPARALTAGGALAAALMLVKVRQTCNCVNGVGGLVHDNHSCRTQAALHRLQCIEIHEHIVTNVLGKHRHRRSARDDGKQVVPPTTHSTAVGLN
eukprot:362866-Chlamydomonas_euryale.AAC.19